MGFSQYPAPGTPKPMQRGKITVGASTTATATIAAVNVSKARLVNLGSKTGGSNGASIALTNATTITVDNGSTAAAEVSWEIVEVY